MSTNNIGFVTTLVKLPAEWRQKAKDELGENEKEVDGAIETLRSWAEQEPWLKTPTDSDFLLRYLRVRKFSQLEARKTLGNFWTNRTKNPDWFKPEVHPENEAILDIIKSVLNMAALEKKYLKLDVVAHALLCIQDWVHMDERVQVNGQQLLLDASVMSLDTTKFINPALYKRFLPIIERSYPDRMKGIHLYGLPGIFESLLALCKPMMKPKARERLQLHSQMVSVYDKVEKPMLPREYLPDDYTGPCAGSIQDVIDYMVKEITRPEVVAHIKDLNSGKYGVDLKLKETSEAPAESFRKLNID